MSWCPGLVPWVFGCWLTPQLRALPMWRVAQWLRLVPVEQGPQAAWRAPPAPLAIRSSRVAQHWQKTRVRHGETLQEPRQDQIDAGATPSCRQ